MGYSFTGNKKILTNELQELEMQHMILGKCGFYWGACPTYIANNCKGCIEEHIEGDFFSRDCVIEKKLKLWKRKSNTSR